MASLRHTQTPPPAEESRLQTDLRASAAVAEASSSNGMHTHRTRRSASTDAGRIYVEAVLDHYLWLPGTPRRASRHDRRLARTLYERGVALAAIRTALVLGAARRALRSKDAPALPPIRTLHYFLPLLEEILELPPDDGYVEYLEAKLAPLADVKAEGSRHIQSG
jgi:hypothetical protein